MFWFGTLATSDFEDPWFRPHWISPLVCVTYHNKSTPGTFAITETLGTQ